ncbi:MAG: hypothetical protein P1U56_26770 [Saprospiraceae bacterium]|nr:hypothetical protein [Saprospiraceae bacterium]
MKKLNVLLILFVLPVFVFAQNIVAMQDVEGRREVSMNDVNGKTTNGEYKYYAKGEKDPFTGILFSKHPNGNTSSWQEYVDGLGQGKWINYYENGNYKEIGNYHQNLVQGSIKKYYPNGKIKAEGNYKDWRIKVGLWNYFDEDGNLKYSKNFGEQGSIEEVQEYYERGDISYSWYYNILTKNGFKI